MRRWILWIAIASVPLLMAGQVVVAPSGYATTAGPAVPMVQPGAPAGMTPEITFRTASPAPVGAGNVTANNIAGAGNATVVPPVVSAAPTQVEYVSPYPTVVGAGSSYAVEVPATAPSGVATRLQGFDRGAGQFNSAYDIGVQQADVSVAEVAREWREKKAALNARTYTNEDINRIQQQYGPAGGGVSGTAVNAGATTAQPATSNQPGSNVAAPPAPSATPENAPPAQPAPATPPPQASAAPPQPQSSAQAAGAGEMQQESNASGQATPQPQNKGAQAGNAELPGTSSPLPALLVLGIAAGSVGLIMTRQQRAK